MTPERGSIPGVQEGALPAPPLRILQGAVPHTIRVCTPDQMLIVEGATCETAIGVISGLLRCFRMTPDGRRLVTRLVRPDGLVGLGRLTAFRSSVEAVVSSTVAEFRIAAVDAAYAAHADVRDAVIEALTAELSTRDRAQFRLGRLWAEERVADFLLEAADATGGDGKGELRMARADIADHLGVTIETVSRAALLSEAWPHRIDRCSSFPHSSVPRA